MLNRLRYKECLLQPSTRQKNLDAQVIASVCRMSGTASIHVSEATTSTGNNSRGASRHGCFVAPTFMGASENSVWRHQQMY